MALEINLVPDIKNEMIKTLKLRNLILFICIIIASASVVVTLIFGIIAGGQSIAINSKKELRDSLSLKLNSYSDLNEFLTIKDQVNNIATTTNEKVVISRIFYVLSALVPTGPDTIRISEFNINLMEDRPAISIDAQANAGQAPFIDYNVLDSFKKSMAYMRYDYGNYVDKDGNTIPAYCMIEKNPDGSYLSDPETKDIYAYWTIFADGCNNIEQESENTNETTESSEGDEENTESELTSFAGYDLEDYNGSKVVKVWRTPQAEWYNPNERPGRPVMTESGEISNVAHFESNCINYELTIKDRKVTKIDTSNNTCELVPGETDDDRITILESSNGRDSSDQLVLRFSAAIYLAPEVFSFNNHHMMAIAPQERRNVTDSYVQLQTIFSERAKDCQEDDAACKGGN